MEELEDTGELNVGISVSRVGSFRLSAFKQRGSIAAVIRCIPFEIPSLDTLGVPPLLAFFAKEEMYLAFAGGDAGTILTLVVLIVGTPVDEHLNPNFTAMQRALDWDDIPEDLLPLVIVSEAAHLQADLRRAQIEPWAWVVNRTMAGTGTTDPLLRQRIAGEARQFARLRGGLANRLYLLPFLAEPPVGIDRLATLS